MAIKKLAYELNPFDAFDIDVPRRNRAEALEDVRAYVHEKILDYVGDGKSPVKGESWKRTLSKEYMKEKARFSSSRIANMELRGDMLDALEVPKISANKISVQIVGEQAPKADGHNNFSGSSNLPQRRFIPGPGQEFKKEIQDGIRKILKRYRED